MNAFPYEAWPNQSVNITATAQNPTDQPDNLTVTVMVDSVWVENQVVEVDASSSKTVEFTVNSTSVLGVHTVKLNTLSGQFTVVQAGYHTLDVDRSGGGSIPLTFTLNGVSHQTPYIVLLPDG